MMTIRCFGKQESFCYENVNRVNSNLRMDFHNNGSNEWLGFRLELMGSFILCMSALFMTILPSSIIAPGVCFLPPVSNELYWFSTRLTMALNPICRERRVSPLVRAVSKLDALLGHLHELFLGEQDGLRREDKAVHRHTIRSGVDEEGLPPSAQLASSW